MNAIEKHAGEVRRTAKSLSPQGRAELLRAIVHAVYEDVKGFFASVGNFFSGVFGNKTE